jgi:hypothetical protein
VIQIGLLAKSASPVTVEKIRSNHAKAWLVAVASIKMARPKSPLDFGSSMRKK